MTTSSQYTMQSIATRSAPQTRESVISAEVYGSSARSITMTASDTAKGLVRRTRLRRSKALFPRAYRSARGDRRFGRDHCQRARETSATKTHLRPDDRDQNEVERGLGDDTDEGTRVTYQLRPRRMSAVVAPIAA